MKNYRIAKRFWFVSIILLTACATTSKVDRLNSSYQSKKSDCEIKFYKDAAPNEHHETIGKIESHIAKNIFFGGKAQLEDEGHNELRQKACILGGDAVVIDDYIETSATEMTHLHIWATVLKFTNQK